jgi:tetratricopeptide (TPR) repeat protein
LAAIEHVHAAGKLHRDLKPSNVLVTREGRVVVLDFGLAVDPELGGVGQTVADESVSGTPAYMAPEQAAGKPATAASDVYALGVMLFEALTGRLPFEGGVGEILAAKQHHAAPRARALAADVPPELDDLCAALLAREPSARPALASLRATFRADARPAQARAAPASSSVALETPAELLGREAELMLLIAAFEATLTGTPLAMFVSGESGMGKTALVTAFVEELRALGRATVLAGRCYERENIPYKGFDALVDELSRHLRKLPIHVAAAVLPREVYALARIFPVLERVSAVAEAPKKHVPDPQDLKQRAFAAFGELITRMRDRTPLVLVVDDLQWIDQDSTRFMRTLLLQPEPPPVLLLCVHRSEGAHDNALLGSVVRAARDSLAFEMRELALGPLAHSALVTLAQRILPQATSADTAVAFASEAQGSPFFLGELARAAPLHVQGAAGRTLADALSLHVHSLPQPAQRLLSLLALAGQPLAPTLVVEASEVASDQAHALLDRLGHEQLVRVSFDGNGQRRIECYHDKIREQVSSALDTAQTSQLALDLARALLARPEADDFYAELLARLFELAGEREQAAEHAAHAAARAFSTLAFERAARLYAQALEHGRFDPARRQLLSVARAESLAHLGQGHAAATAFQEAAVGAVGDEAYELIRKASEQYLMCGEMKRGRALLAQALEQIGISFPLSIPSALAALTWSRMRLRLRGLGFRPRAHHDANTLRKLTALRTATHGLVRSDPVRAADFCARWLLCALDSGHSLEIGRALAWEIFFASFLGEPETRLETLKALCTQLAENTDDPMTAQFLAYCEGIHLIVRVGEAATAALRFEQTLALIQANPNATTVYDHAWAQYFLANACFGRGEISRVCEVLLPQLDAVVARGDQTLFGMYAHLAIVVSLAIDRPEQAKRILADVVAHFYVDEVTASDVMMSFGPSLITLYEGDARTAWHVGSRDRERLMKSLQCRVIMTGWLESFYFGIAAVASQQAESKVEREQFLRAARKLARRASKVRGNFAMCPTGAVLACLNGDRGAAIAVLRTRLEPGHSNPPVTLALLRYRLGQLCGGEEGAATLADAEAALRAGGVVDVPRFVNLMMPGTELPPA